MRKPVLIILPLVLLVTMACSISLGTRELTREPVSGNQVTEQREVSGFNRIEFSGVGDLTISQGAQESLTVEADDSIIDHIRTRVSGNTLTIELERNFSITGITNIHYTLVVKDLSRLVLSGFGNINIDQLQTSSLDIELSGSGQLELADLQADSLKVVVSGFGNAEVSGEVQELTVDIQGTGNFEGGDLRSQSAQVEVGGFGNATLWVEDELDARISGTGNIKYYGVPRVTQDVAGFGELKSLGNK